MSTSPRVPTSPSACARSLDVSHPAKRPMSPAFRPRGFAESGTPLEIVEEHIPEFPGGRILASAHRGQKVSTRGEFAAKLPARGAVLGSRMYPDAGRGPQSARARGMLSKVGRGVRHVAKCDQLVFMRPMCQEEVSNALASWIWTQTRSGGSSRWLTA